jgi:hypothetical protein
MISRIPQNTQVNTHTPRAKGVAEESSLAKASHKKSKLDQVQYYVATSDHDPVLEQSI